MQRKMFSTRLRSILYFVVLFGAQLLISKESSAKPEDYLGTRGVPQKSLSSCTPNWCKYPAMCQSDTTWQCAGCCMGNKGDSKADILANCASECIAVSQDNNNQPFSAHLNPDAESCSSGYRCLCWAVPLDPNC
jgi:hypothetical protein